MCNLSLALIFFGLKRADELVVQETLLVQNLVLDCDVLPL